MLIKFINEKLKQAHYELLEDGTYYGEIPGLKGVWSNSKKLENCRQELQEVLEGWLVLKIRDGDKVPGLNFPDFLEHQSFAKNAKHA